MGHWIWTNADKPELLYPTEFKCSDCGFHMGYTPKEHINKYLKFCPYCGKSKEGGLIPLSKLSEEVENESSKV